MAIEIFNRQELKFVITAEQYAQIVAGIAPHMQPDKHNRNGQTYRLHNLYIDTNDHALIRHSIAKPTVYKEKLRIRSYTGFEDNPVVFLEVKKRFKRITNKRRTRVPYDEALEFIATGTLPRQHDYMNTQVVRELETMIRARSYQPKTFITYDRLAFSASDPASDLRVTFDTNITAQRYGENETTALLGDGRIVMELKSCHNVPLWLVELLSRYGVQKQSFSKYGREYLGYLQRTALPTAEPAPSALITPETTPLIPRSTYA